MNKSMSITDSKIKNYSFESLQKKISYYFNNLELLHEAMSHPSCRQHDKSLKNYERFELLGDALLGFLIAESLLERFKDYSDGKIAKIKAYLVSSEVIFEIANTIQLYDYIIMTEGEENSGGRKNQNNIENAMEALIAAIYLDSNINTVRKLVINLWSTHLDNKINLHLIDPKSSLQELVQSRGDTAPVYSLIKKVGLDHTPIFTIKLKAGIYTEIGRGNSLKLAEKDAAKKLLHKLKSIVN